MPPARYDAEWIGRVLFGEWLITCLATWTFPMYPSYMTRVQIELDKLITVPCVIFWNLYFFLSIYFCMVLSSFTWLCGWICTLQVSLGSLLHGDDSRFDSFIFGRLTLQVVPQASCLFLFFFFLTSVHGFCHNMQTACARALGFSCWAFGFFFPRCKIYFGSLGMVR